MDGCSEPSASRWPPPSAGGSCARRRRHPLRARCRCRPRALRCRQARPPVPAACRARVPAVPPRSVAAFPLPNRGRMTRRPIATSTQRMVTGTMVRRHRQERADRRARRRRCPPSRESRRHRPDPPPRLGLTTLRRTNTGTRNTVTGIPAHRPRERSNQSRSQASTLVACTRSQTATSISWPTSEPRRAAASSPHRGPAGARCRGRGAGRLPAAESRGAPPHAPRRRAMPLHDPERRAD